MRSGKSSEAQRNQILGHKGSTVIQFYMPELVGFDTQGCYLGNTSRELLVVYSHMSLWRDANAPTELIEVKLLGIYNNPRGVKAQKELDEMKATARAQYGTLTNCKLRNPELSQQIEKAKKDLENFTLALKQDTFKRERSQYFEEVHLKELQQQLSPQPEDGHPKKVKRLNAFRMRIAAAFEQKAGPLMEPKAFSQARKALLVDLVQLCSEASRPPLCSFCESPYTGSRSEHNLTHFKRELENPMGRLIKSVHFAFGIWGSRIRAGLGSFQE